MKEVYTSPWGAYITQDYLGLGSNTSLVKNFSVLPQTASCGETRGRASNCWLFSQAKFVTNWPLHLGQRSLCTL